MMKPIASRFLLLILVFTDSPTSAQNSPQPDKMEARLLSQPDPSSNENKAETKALPTTATSDTAVPATRKRTRADELIAAGSTARASSKGLQFGDESGWELFLAGGGSFWSHQDASLSINDILQVTPDPGLGVVGTTKYRVRQAFAPGGRFVAGVVKNFNDHAAVEVSYSYGTNNFKLTAQEAINLLGVTLAPQGYSRSIGMRSHVAGLNYRHSLANNNRARIYLTGGFNLTVFEPTNKGLDQLFGLNAAALNDFKQKPTFRTVVAPGVNFGAGVILKATETFGFRFDVRDYLTFTRRVRGTAELKTGEKLELNLFGDTLHNLVPTFGVVFMLR